MDDDSDLTDTIEDVLRCECGTEADYAELEQIPETKLFQIVRGWCPDCMAAEIGLMKLEQEEQQEE
jgi:hypothetical protein